MTGRVVADQNDGKCRRLRKMGKLGRHPVQQALRV
jgi:hypothetical protein